MNKDIIIFNKIITDKKSKYTVSGCFVQSKTDVEDFLDKLKEDKKIRKATHNSYAYMYNKEGDIVFGKSDDGEAGAGNVILNVLQNSEKNNLVVCVTRWFGGVKLGSDRFKHIKKATEYFLDNI